MRRGQRRSALQGRAATAVQRLRRRAEEGGGCPTARPRACASPQRLMSGSWEKSPEDGEPSRKGRPGSSCGQDGGACQRIAATRSAGDVWVPRPGIKSSFLRIVSAHARRDVSHSPAAAHPGHRLAHDAHKQRGVVRGVQCQVGARLVVPGEAVARASSARRTELGLQHERAILGCGSRLSVPHLSHTRLHWRTPSGQVAGQPPHLASTSLLPPHSATEGCPASRRTASSTSARTCGEGPSVALA
jgi:hypothetical protein